VDILINNASVFPQSTLLDATDLELSENMLLAGEELTLRFFTMVFTTWADT